MTTLSIAVNSTIGTPSAWVANTLSSVAFVALQGAQPGARVALYGQTSNASPPIIGDLLAILNGPGTQSPPILNKAYYAVTGLTLPGGASVNCQLSDGVAASPGPSSARIYGIAQTLSTPLSGGSVVTYFTFDPSLFSSVGRTIKVKAQLFVNAAGQTCTLTLSNFTDGGTVKTLTSTSLTPEAVEATITVLTDIPNSSRVYAMTITRTGGTSANQVSCANGYVEVSY